MKQQILVLAGLLLLAGRSQAQSATAVSTEVDAIYPESEALYLDLHRHPELSGHEQQTAANIALSACVEDGSNPFTTIGPAIAPATSRKAPPLQSPSTVYEGAPAFRSPENENFS